MKGTPVTFVHALLQRQTPGASDPRKRITKGSVSAFVLAVVILSPVAAQAERWGDFQKEACVAIGKRQYSSRLWDIPWGKSWEEACKNMPAPTTINGIPFSGQKRCVKDAFSTGIWGQFDVPDPSCPHWGPFTNECAKDKDNVRYYYAALMDIPSGISWEQTCQNFPANVAGRHFDKPAFCVTQAHVYGYFAVDDPACPKVGTGAAVSGTPPGWKCPAKPSCPTGKLLSCEMLASGSPTAKGGFPVCDAKGWYCCGGINKDPSRCPSENGFWYPPGCD